MKIIITEEQLKLIVEYKEKDNLIDFTHVNKSGFPAEEWDDMFLLMKEKKERKGDKTYNGYYITGDVNLHKSDVTELNYLVRVGGMLDLENTSIKSLPMLSEVGLSLYLRHTQIESLPMLSKVGLNLYLRGTPLSKTTTEEELRKQINVEWVIYL